MPGGDLADVWKAIAGLKVPAEVLAEAQRAYLVEATAIWNRLLVPGAAPSIGDRRFASPEWTGNPSGAFLAELYLLNARTLLELAKAVEGDPKTQARVRFAVLQWIDAAAPSNYLALNPEAQKKAIETKGESLVHGLTQLWNDAQRGHLSQTDESAFEVGRNVATSEGSVIFENELFQLIEYAPLTAKIHERPILFVPPCINKFYILDLQPENSVIRHTVAEGAQRVFLISWRNAREDIAQRTWDDYIDNAVLRAIA
ncbi:MAG TPA: class I poly(R)-hydroxyalkanoic acid synthase, partial [Caldimonas sp.]